MTSPSPPPPSDPIAADVAMLVLAAVFPAVVSAAMSAGGTTAGHVAVLLVVAGLATRPVCRVAAHLATRMPITADLASEQLVVEAVEAEPSVDIGTALDGTEFAWPALARRYVTAREGAAGPAGPTAGPDVAAAAQEVAASAAERVELNTVRSPIVTDPAHDPDVDTHPGGHPPIRRQLVPATTGRVACCFLILLLGLGGAAMLAAATHHHTAQAAVALAGLAGGTVVVAGLLVALVDRDTLFAPTGLLGWATVPAAAAAVGCHLVAGTLQEAGAVLVVAVAVGGLLVLVATGMSRLLGRPAWGGADTRALPLAFGVPAVTAGDPRVLTFGLVIAGLVAVLFHGPSAVRARLAGAGPVPFAALPILCASGMVGWVAVTAFPTLLAA